MLFLVKMTVSLPPDLDRDIAERLRSDERAVAEELQRTGKWRHLWRIVGQYANISIFDDDDFAFATRDGLIVDVLKIEDPKGDCGTEA